MKVLVTSIVAVALCIGMVSQTLAQGTNDVKKGHGEHQPPAFEKIDANNDGKISWDEMLAFHTTIWQARYQEESANHTPKKTWEEVLAKRTAELKERFQKMDANKDGFITKDEWKTFHESNKELHGEGHEHKGAPAGGAPVPANG